MRAQQVQRLTLKCEVKERFAGQSVELEMKRTIKLSRVQEVSAAVRRD